MEGLAKLGIDPLSILIYILNTGLMLAVLTFVLYKPVLRFLDERRKMISDSVNEARNLKDELDKKSHEAATAQSRFEVELKRERENLQKFLEERRTQLDAEMRAARTEMLEKAQANIDAREAELMSQVELKVRKLMEMIVLDVVRHKVPEHVVRESVEDAWKASQSLGQSTPR